MRPWLQIRGAGVSIRIRAKPNARATRIASDDTAAELRVEVHAPPVEGAANGELIAFFAKLIGVPKKSVSVGIGAAARTKVLFIDGVDAPLVERSVARALSGGTR